MNKNPFLWRMVNDPHFYPHKVFSFVIQALILISLVTFSIDTLPGLDPDMKRVFYYIEVATVIIFTAEYLLRIFVTDKKLRFIFSFYGLIDLAAVLPFYLATSLDLRSVRVFRFLRLLRVLKLFRYNKALKRFYRAFSLIKDEMLLFLFIAALMLYLSAVGIYYFESVAQPEQFKSVFHSLWWAITTLTTVGYGDMYPITAGGKMFTFVVLMIGLGVVAVPTGLLASALTQAREEENKQ